jgi:putative heme-binding domain-containing protein
LTIPDAAKVQLLAAVMNGGTTPEKQGAFEVLGGLKSPESRRLLGQSLDELQAGKIAPELQVDLLEAVQADASPELMARVTAYQQAKKADTLQAAFRDGLLKGGDARRGAQVVFQNPLAECTRCHAVRGGGADVGPNLSRIGSTLTRDQLLDSLVNPNLRIAPGYGLVSVTLKDGRKLDGTLREETDTHLVLLAGTPPAEQRIAKGDIAERSNPLSAMPPLGLMLTPREVRDVVEYLASLK